MNCPAILKSALARKKQVQQITDSLDMANRTRLKIDDFFVLRTIRRLFVPLFLFTLPHLYSIEPGRVLT